MRISLNLKSQSGFAIFTVPVIILMFGLFMAKLVRDTSLSDTDFETRTKKELSETRKTLSAYVHRHYHLPCPAAPDAPKETLGIAAPWDENGYCSITSGLLPYHELGLPASAAKDAWGNFLTYKISPAFAKNPILSALDFIGDKDEPLPISKNGAQNTLHQMCRTENWISKTTNKYELNNGKKQLIPSQKLNNNIYKANFCCPSYIADKNYIELRARDYQKELKSGKKRTLDFNGDIQLSAQIIDKIPFWNPNENVQMRKDSQTLRNKNPYFNYVIYKQSDDYIEDGVGPIDGAFFNTAATLTLNPLTMNVKTLTIQLADIRQENWGEPVPVTIEVVNKEGKKIGTIGYTLKIPKATSGTANINISILTILKGPVMEGLYYEGHWHNYDKIAQEWFLQNKREFITTLLRSKINLKDVRIGQVKLNATHTPLSISKIGYTKPSIPNLTILNEKNKSRLPSRNNPNAYADANIKFEGSSVEPDNAGVAYVLMSHGANGEGAFMGNGSAAIINNIDNTLENPRELLNYANSIGRRVSDVRRTISSDPRRKFDDIIQWDSQISLYGALNGGSCSDAL